MLANLKLYFRFASMLDRNLEMTLRKDLEIFPIVGILGSRQVGKTTLGLKLSKSFHKPSVYLDLELPSDRMNLEHSEFYLNSLENHLIVIDEIQRMPELFPLLRALVDKRKRKGEKNAQFMILGSSSPELLKHSSESLAGRIVYHELPPFGLGEVSEEMKLWLKGGYPESFLNDEETSFLWRENFLTTLIERDIPKLIGDYPSDRLFRLWRLLAQDQGGIINFSKLGGTLGITGVTVRTYIEKLIGLYLFRFLPPWTGNISKRLIRSPKLYFRDTGILHQLLGIRTKIDLLNSKVCGDSWEGFAIEQILQNTSKSTLISFYRSSVGNEIDLVLEYSSGKTDAIEIKLSTKPSISKGFHIACEDIQATRKIIIIPGKEKSPIEENFFVMGLQAFLHDLKS